MKIQNKSALSIIRGLKGNQTTGMCRCPAHDDEKPSLKVCDGRKGVLVRCYAGCEQDAVIAALKNKGLWKPTPVIDQGKLFKRKSKRAHSLTDSKESPEEEKAERVRRALCILRTAREPKAGEVEYLKNRGIDKVPENALILSANDSNRLTGKRFPALVFPVANADGRLLGCHLTWLDKDRKTKLDTDSPRRMFGPIKGGFVQLGRPIRNKPLIAAEGIETALSASQITGLPVIAAMSASNLQCVTVPRCKELIICGDNDNAGRKAAKALARKLSVEGKRVVRIAIPYGAGDDWNDVLTRGNNVKRHRCTILKARKFEKPNELGAIDENELISRPIAEFDAKPLNWLWEPFFLSGAVNLLYGDGDMGKSTITLDLAARITTGQAMPNCDVDKAISGSVIIMSKEDEIGTVMRPRLESAGADISKVHTVGYVMRDGEFNVIDELATNIGELEKNIKKIGDVKLIIIDPVASFAGKLELNSDKDVRALLDPLRLLAGRHDLAVIAINHLTKATDSNARQRAIGSVALINNPRSALLVASDSKDADRRLMVQVKGNLCAVKNQSIGFFFKQARAFARLIWEDEICVTNPDELLESQGARTKKDQSIQLLKEWLSEGPVAQREIKELAEQHDIGWRTVEAAKAVAGILPEKRKDGWYWRLPN